MFFPPSMGECPALPCRPLEEAVLLVPPRNDAFSPQVESAMQPRTCTEPTLLPNLLPYPPNPLFYPTTFLIHPSNPPS